MLIITALMTLNGLYAKPNTQYLSEALGGRKVDSVLSTPLPNIHEIVVDGQTIYLSEDGRYAFQGNMIDLKTGENLTEKRFSIVRQTQLKNIPLNEMIIYKPVKTEHVVYIFTDIDCGYCRKLHSELQSYLDLGIEIRYLAFPRTGPDTVSSAKYDAVWCSKDRHSAMTEAKAGKEIQAEKCDTPVAKQFKLGVEMGVNGTPAIILEDGTLVPGYMPAKELREMLDQNRKLTQTPPKQDSAPKQDAEQSNAAKKDATTPQTP